jgi:GTPase SAR1 family protein
MDHSKFSIALWGPSGSGKSWLIDAFVAQLYGYNVSEDKDFEFKLLDSQGNRVAYQRPEPNSPTIATRDFDWQLTRQACEKVSSVPRYRISSHTHNLHIRDHNGQASLEMLDQTWKVRETKLSFEGVNCVIVVLDHSLLKTENLPQRGKSQQISTVKLTAQYYAENVRLFLEMLLKDEKRPEVRWVAVCLAKADLMSDPEKDKWCLIEEYFGKTMADELIKFKKNRNLELRVFTISAAGFLDGPGSPANFDDHGLRQVEMWQPWNVLAPFFWFLEGTERDRLKYNGKLLVRILFSGNRRRLYEPYV